jgi:hypothetical protein
LIALGTQITQVMAKARRKKVTTRRTGVRLVFRSSTT